MNELNNLELEVVAAGGQKQNKLNPSAIAGQTQGQGQGQGQGQAQGQRQKGI
jgi:hypothetical protein